MSAVVHECAHGLAALVLGDDTAKNAGRLTLNPLVHLDWIGSVLLPVLFILSGSGFMIAWAKPVPYNPYNLRDKKYGDLKVALAGPAANFCLAVLFGLLGRALILTTGQPGLDGSLPHALSLLTIYVCLLNLGLMIFNLMPVPPLDGSKIILTFLSAKGKIFFYRFELYGMIIIAALAVFGAFDFIYPLIAGLGNFILGGRYL